MLKIKNLHASVDGKEILKGINLDIKAGEIHAIMGPNGSGKSTLASVISGKEDRLNQEIIWKSLTKTNLWTKYTNIKKNIMLIQSIQDQEEKMPWS